VAKDLDFSDYLFGMIDISENVINELYCDDLSSMNVLCFNDFAKASFSEILHKLVVLSDKVPFRGENEIALLLLRCSLFHYNSQFPLLLYI
jgi:hypothetical protein